MADYPKDQYGIPKDRTKECEDATEALIGSQVRAIRNFVSDFLNESPNCPHHDRSECEHPLSVIIKCEFNSCPLQ
jgi:hypothetical protein